MKKPGFQFWWHFTGAVCGAILLGSNIAGDRSPWGLLWFFLTIVNLASAVDVVWPESEKE